MYVRKYEDNSCLTKIDMWEQQLVEGLIERANNLTTEYIYICRNIYISPLLLLILINTVIQYITNYI